jgi:rubrerythrin
MDNEDRINDNVPTSQNTSREQREEGAPMGKDAPLLFCPRCGQGLSDNESDRCPRCNMRVVCAACG